VKRFAWLSLILLLVVALSGVDFKLYDDLDIAASIARLEKKDLILMFSSDSCYYCTKFKEETLMNDEVRKLLNANFVMVEVTYDADKKSIILGDELKYSQLFDVFGIRGTPTFWFLTMETTPLTFLPGYVPAKDFSAVLRYIAQRLFAKGVKFKDYVKENDDFLCEPKLVKLSSEEIEYLMKLDPLVRKLREKPSKVERWRTYVVESTDLAHTLMELGVSRVVLSGGE